MPSPTPCCLGRPRENPPGAGSAPWKARNARSGTQSLAAARAPRRNHLAAALGGHTGTKTVTTLAHQLAGLVGPLHDESPGGAAFSAMAGGLQFAPTLRASVQTRCH